MKRYPRILYFINGPIPSEEDEIDSFNCGANVVFRNANFVPLEGSPENCDGVAGKVPPLYAHKPTAEQALEAFEKERNAKRKAAKARQKQQDLVGEVPKPTGWKPNK